MTELFDRAADQGDRLALTEGDRGVRYAELLTMAGRLSHALRRLAGPDRHADLAGDRVAVLIPPSAEYVAAQWGVWHAGGMFVPLSMSAAEAELEYAVADSDPRMVLTTAGLRDRLLPVCERLGVTLHGVEDKFDRDPAEPLPPPDVSPGRPAMMLYTSGTTSRPKGVVITHAMLDAQIRSLVEAWRWGADDRIPLFLPLHHIHGIVNVLSCCLWSGGTVDVMPRFEMKTLLDRVAAGRYGVFMAVPTIYVKLLQTLTPDHPAVAGFRDMRLMVSGSAALPASVHDAWHALTGQKLLERYGMTEIGMALSNPYEGERRPGAVGRPLPGVEAVLVAEDGSVVEAEGEPGEIHVRGPAVFSEYWRKPDQTAKAFTTADDPVGAGWFRTGDMAVVEAGYHRIFGRASVDVIKSGGYKLSALEIEAALLEHDAIAECAVVGLPDETWGEVVAAALVCDGDPPTVEELHAWAKDRLSHYKLPRRLLVTDALPRNAMGKLTKPAVRDLFEDAA